ncbi:MAG: acyl-CoA/acyl-ACP dehydrogenase [Novosphingobium sp.]|nr:acyl-CoA/acyl-ACP dehydrogenase [Novosphingobium sp.]
MDFNLSDLQRMLRDSAERFIAKHYTLEHRRSLRLRADGLDAQAWASFAELGWLALLVPQELGGLGGSMADAAILASVLGSRCVTEPFASSAVLGVTLLVGAKCPDRELVGAVMAGAARLALAHEESGLSLTARRKAKLAPGAQGLALTGTKTMVFDAPSATHVIITAEGPSGLALILTPRESALADCDVYMLYDGSRAADIRLKGVAVDPGAILAEGEEAEGLLSLALDRTRVILAAQAVGSMEAELDICSAYLKDRHQFGQPIGKFQALQHIMADMFVATHQARSALYFALSRLDAPAPERSRAVALARLNISEAAQLVSRQAIQLHGGYGVTDEYEVSHHYRRQLVLEKQYGDLDLALQQAWG